MDVIIKEFNCTPTIKKKGVQFQVRATQSRGGNLMGVFIVSSRGIEWRPGGKPRDGSERNKECRWEDIPELFESTEKD